MLWVEPLLSGIIFGLANGLSPGPTLFMIISQTLQNDLKKGIQIALSPIIFGIFIIPCSLLLVSSLVLHRISLFWITLLGAIYFCYLGSCLIIAASPTNATQDSFAFTKSIFSHFASPGAYLFWFSFGAPYLLNTSVHSYLRSTIFLFSYYLFLIGSKIAIGIAVAKAKLILDSTYYPVIVRCLGLILIIFAIYYIGQAADFL